MAKASKGKKREVEGASHSEGRAEAVEAEEGKRGRIWKIAGPLVVAEGMRGCEMYEVVRVGEEGLICLLYTSPSPRDRG